MNHTPYISYLLYINPFTSQESSQVHVAQPLCKIICNCFLFDPNKQRDPIPYDPPFIFAGRRKSSHRDGIGIYDPCSSYVEEVLYILVNHSFSEEPLNILLSPLTSPQKSVRLLWSPLFSSMRVFYVYFTMIMNARGGECRPVQSSFRCVCYWCLWTSQWVSHQ